MIESIVYSISKLIASPIYAQETPPPRIEEILVSIDGLFQWIFPIGGILAVAMIIYGGYMWIISGGDPSKKQAAQGTLTWAIIGLVFLFLIGAILQAILEFVVS